ncbi:GntR family transcriptional regulator [Virgibacillus sp. FSP13]
MKQSAIAIEKKIISTIIRGEYKVNSQLKPERELAIHYGVGRPTIREVLQRLSFAGWITMQKGQPAIVNDFWKEGNIKTLVDIVENYEKIPDEFILYFLEIRGAITPKYVKDAVMHYHPKVVAALAEMDTLSDRPEDYALFDWNLQKSLAGLSDNPIYLLLLNSFDRLYVRLATAYFSLSFCRNASYSYYKELMEAALKGDYKQAEKAASFIMEKSSALWKNHVSSEIKEDEETMN